MKETKDSLQAAEVVVLIIKNEGSLQDSIEYPQEFNNAYSLLLEYEIVELREGMYVPGKNFSHASRFGVGTFIERDLDRKILKRKYRKKWILGIIPGAALISTIYFLKKARN